MVVDGAAGSIQITNQLVVPVEMVVMVVQVLIAGPA